ncbi:glycosyl hydrolase family 43 [Vallitalea pronyensis]|uniref:Glycosyl hydrolase family 43 n=1 Tax=Vallitalea pronyensis TaxID=1348613 RepID=A0A8J8MNY0_9FIRM|nr:glycoside hydrolase family protein [Vallitalea pronyensis]QUI24683.1 glycosyl hydrolase family 43 [Vallitalea pronyensis]
MIEKKQSLIGKQLEGVGRILEEEKYNVWGCSPIYDEDGRVHVFYARWENKYDHLGWVAACEVAHAVADSPEGPYKHVGVVLQGRGGQHWDSWSIHNPSVYKVDDKYIILYMGSDGSNLGKTLDEIGEMDGDMYKPYFHKLVNSKRVGMAIADSLDGPFVRVSDQEPMIHVGDDTDWDSFCTSNPTFTKTPEGKYRIYYKAWSQQTAAKFNGNRQYGFAESDTLTGPYKKYEGNPVIDYSYIEERVQAEDGYIWYEDNKYHMVMRDMGVFNHEYGLYIESKDGIEWSEPSISYLDAPSYFDEAMPGLTRQGRFERPQLLLKDGSPTHLFCAYRGGKYNTSSGVVLKINKNK